MSILLGHAILMNFFMENIEEQERGTYSSFDFINEIQRIQYIHLVESKEES